MTISEVLTSQLDRLAAFEPGPFPVISLYLNMQPDEHGRDHFDVFLRNELTDRITTYPAEGPERKSLEQDADRIRAYVAEEVRPSANGLALFACGGNNLFEAVQLLAPIDEHRLFVSDQPHLYPLARLLDEYPKYAVLVADTHLARIVVFAANEVERAESIEGVKTRRHKMGGWSQARYQRHVDNYRAQHAKEVAEALRRVVRQEAITSVIIAGDDVIVPLVKEHLTKEVADRVVDVVKLDIRAPVHEILEASAAAMREKDAQTDRERVEALIGAYRANALACAGADATRAAFELGQVEELVIAARPDAISTGSADSTAAPGQLSADEHERVADELIAQARKTAARIRFIEDVSLLDPIGGVGAFLRFKV
jgi:peptide chain release factor subunit 1